MQVIYVLRYKGGKYASKCASVCVCVRYRKLADVDINASKPNCKRGEARGSSRTEINQKSHVKSKHRTH